MNSGGGKDTQIKQQLDALASSMEQQSERCKKATEDFKGLKKRLFEQLRLEQSSELREMIDITLETAFTLGQSAGESSEGTLVFKEQLTMVRTMVEDIDRHNKQIEARDVRTAEREDEFLKNSKKMVAMQERQTKALEVLAAGGSKPALKAALGRKRRKLRRSS